MLTMNNPKAKLLRRMVRVVLDEAREAMAADDDGDERYTRSRFISAEGS